MLLDVHLHLPQALTCALVRFLDARGQQNQVEVLHKLDDILAALGNIATQEEQIMATNQEILDEVTAQGTVADSVLAIVQALAAENDPVRRQAIFDGLKANRAKLEAAVLAGTPTAPAPVPNP